MCKHLEKTASFKSKRLGRSFADIEHFNINYDNFWYIHMLFFTTFLFLRKFHAGS